MSQPHIAIIGAGHAGVEAAFALAKGGAKVTLLSDEPCLPYFRPRLIAVAFGQADPDAIAIKPQKAYDEAGIDLRHESATDVAPAARTVNGRAYDGLIVATGSRPFVPPFAGCRERALPLWTMADALAIRERFETARSVAIVGAGVLGIEAACRAATRLGAGRTRLIEPARAMLGGMLGEDEQPLFRALRGLAELEPHIGCGVRDIGESALTLTDGTVVDADLVVCATGARPNGRLLGAEGFVRTADDLSFAPCVYAAGDPCQPTETRPVCQVRRAQLMGQLAATNLLAELGGRPTAKWNEPDLPLNLITPSATVFVRGEMGDANAEVRHLDVEEPLYEARATLHKEGKLVGLRWVNTRKDLTEWEKRLGSP